MEQHSKWRIGDTPHQPLSEKETVHWMPTHLWHAKRFIMVNHFGWKVPLQHNGRGARPIHRLLREGKPTIQDATWRSQPVAFMIRDVPKTIMALQRVLPTISIDEDVLRGRKLVDGVLHYADKFPLQAIGPVTVWIRIYESKAANRKDSRTEGKVYVFCHPSVTDQVWACFGELVNSNVRNDQNEKDSNKNGDTSPITQPFRPNGGVAILQLRGCDEATTSSLRTVASPKDESDLSINGDHLSAHLCRIESASFQNVHRRTSHQDGSSSDGVVPAFTIMAVRRRPNSFEDPSNYGVSGWDLLCQPSDSAAVFGALVCAGKCVPIGAAEEAHVLSECMPPIPSFPRDFPDSIPGRDYWNVNPVGDWADLRSRVESGWGRTSTRTPERTRTSAPTPAMTECSPVLCDWSKVVLPDNDDSDGCGPTKAKDEHPVTEDLASGACDAVAVVVRGGFGEPFVDCLASLAAQWQPGSAHLSDDNLQSDPTVAEQKRKEPRQRNHGLVTVPSLSLEKTEVCRVQFASMLNSLSLPALLRCEIRVHGKGTIETGDGITGVDRNDPKRSMFLGWIVHGGFSPSRGGCHGVGFVGAARLLRFLIEYRSEMVVDKRDEYNGKIWMKVVVVGATAGHERRGGNPADETDCVLSFLL